MKKNEMQHLSTCSCSRRSFLHGSGLTLAGFGIASLFPMPFIRHAMAGQGDNDKRLLFIFLRGGNDGINTVIPHGDIQYSPTIRPSLYIPPAAAHDLNGFASLHPALGDMLDVYNAGDLAVVHRVGYANNSKSHFDGQRIWENGDPTQSTLYEGWLYRAIKEAMIDSGVELPAMSIQTTQPVLLRGNDRFVNIANPDNFEYYLGEPKATKLKRIWSNVFSGLTGLEPYRPALSQTGLTLMNVLAEYESWDQAGWNPLDPVTGYSLFPVDGSSNPNGMFSPASYDFFQSLKICALALLESDVVNNNGTRVAGTQVSGWDTHGGQGATNGAHAELLSWLAYGMRSLHVVLSGSANDPRNYPGIWDKATVATLSEFGRTTEENGSQGTDHAAASCMFLAGGAVNGGVYNCDAGTWPSGVMFGVDERYLLHRTDFRSIFWEILRDHMGVSSSSADVVFPGYSSSGLGAGELGLVSV